MLKFFLLILPCQDIVVLDGPNLEVHQLLLNHIRVVADLMEHVSDWHVHQQMIEMET